MELVPAFSKRDKGGFFMLKKGTKFEKLVEQIRDEILENEKELERIDLLLEERHSIMDNKKERDG